MDRTGGGDVGGGGKREEEAVRSDKAVARSR